MTDELTYLIENSRKLTKKQLILGLCLLTLLLIVLGYFWAFRPEIEVASFDGHKIYVSNQGGMDAVIFKVDGFWYWAGKVGFLANIPEIEQKVKEGNSSVLLQIPSIPSPVDIVREAGPYYMRLVIRYGIPGFPIFRYSNTLFFEYDPNKFLWSRIEQIPARFKIPRKHWTRGCR